MLKAFITVNVINTQLDFFFTNSILLKQNHVNNLYNTDAFYKK